MAKKKSERQKTTLPSHVETLLGITGRQGLKGGTARFMNWLRTNHEDTYFDVAYIVTDKEAAAVKNTFTGGLVLTALLAENIGDALKVNEGVMEVVEVVFGDLPGTINDYFEMHKPVFPPTWKKPSLEVKDIEKLTAKFIQFLKVWIDSTLGNWKKPVTTIIEKLLTDPRQMMFKNLAKIGDEKVKAFFRNIEGVSVADRNYLAQCINLIDDLDELDFWASRSTKQLKQSIAWAKRVENQQLLRRWLREAYKNGKKHWPTVERYMVQQLRQLDRNLGRAEAAMTDSNRRRQRAINRERYSEKNIKDKPWRSNELKEGDPRRIEQPGVVRRLATNPLIWIVVGFILLTMVVAGSVGVSGMFRDPPTVTITSPMNDAKVTAAPIISGEARDAERVSSMEYQVNNGNRIPLSISPARRVRWSVQVDTLTYGMIHVVVYATGENGKVGTSELHLFRSEPAPPVVAPDSGLIAASVVLDTLGDNRVRVVRTVRHLDGRVERDSVKLQVIQ